MKTIKILGHPAALSSIFLLLIIEGDNFGGFYLIYLLFALPHGAIYSLLALVGVGIVVVNHNMRQNLIKSLLYILGPGVMIISLFVFFAKGNKYATFEQTIPLLTFIAFGISVVCYLLHSFSPFSIKKKKDAFGITV